MSGVGAAKGKVPTLAAGDAAAFGEPSLIDELPADSPRGPYAEHEPDEAEPQEATPTSDDAFGAFVPDPAGSNDGGGDTRSESGSVLHYASSLLAKEVPLSFALKHFASSRKAKQLFRDLCVYIPFVLWFTFYSYFRRETLEGHYMSSAMSDALYRHETPPTGFDVPLDGARNEGPHFPKRFADIDTANDWHNWLERVVIPRFFDSRSPNISSPRDAILGANLFVGSLRVRSHRVNDNSCDVNREHFPEGFTQQCWAEYSTDAMRRSAIPFASANASDPDLDPAQTFPFTDGCDFMGMGVVGWWRRYPCGGFIVDFSVDMTFNDALARAIALREEGFVDVKATRFLAVEFFTYSPSIDMFLSTRLFHEVTASGGWIPTRRFRSFTAWNNTTNPQGILAFEFLFFIFVMYYIVRYFVRWFRFARKTGRLARFVFIFWNFAELTNLALFIVSFAVHWEWWRRSTSFNVDLPDPTLPYPEMLNYIMELYYLELYILSFNTVLTYLMVMKYFEMNSRLNILTRTLEASAQNVVGVLIIFILIVTSYALAGMVLYGHAVYDFRNMSIAFSSLFLTLLGSFDYDGLRRENRGWTFLYFWTFMILSLFLMLNFITAIIGNGLEAEQSKTKPLPLNVQLRRLSLSMKRYTLRQRLSNFVAAVITRTRRLPDDIIEEQLQDLRRTLLQEDGITQDAIDAGDIDEPEYIFDRALLDEVLPDEDREAIGRKYLDNIFIEMVEDFEINFVATEGEEELLVIQACEPSMGRGFKDIFVDGKDAITATQRTFLSGEVEQDKGQVMIDGRRHSFRRHRTSSLTAELNALETSARSSAASDSQEAAADTSKLTRRELLDKLMGEQSKDAAARAVAAQLLDRGGLSSVTTHGIGQMRQRISKVEASAEGLNVLMNILSHKILQLLEKKGQHASENQASKGTGKRQTKGR